MSIDLEVEVSGLNNADSQSLEVGEYGAEVAKEYADKAFILIWIAVPLGFAFVASLLTKALDAVHLGWLNRWLREPCSFSPSLK